MFRCGASTRGVNCCSKRTCRGLLLCLLAGFLATISVAWLGVLIPHAFHFEPDFTNPVAAALGRREVWYGWHTRSTMYQQFIATPHSGRRDKSAEEFFEVLAGDGEFGRTVVQNAAGFPRSQILAAEAAVREGELQPDAQGFRGGIMVQVQGWPLRCAAWRQVWGAYPVGAGTPLRTEGALHVPASVLGGKGDGILLALTPMWRGLVGNTVFYATLVIAAVYGPKWLVNRRRQRRFRRGLCPMCHYNLAGTLAAVCPECGAELSPWAKPTDAAASR
jgi:hypothetical protein